MLMRMFRSGALAVALIAAALLVSLPGQPRRLPAQSSDHLAPWVVVVPVYNETEAAALDAVGDSIANTIGLSLRLLGDFEVRTVPRDRIPAEVIAGVRESVAAFAERETMDYVVLGSVRRVEEEIQIASSVWERASGTITVTETRSVGSLLDTFDAADSLALDFLSAFSGQRIAFGAIALFNTGWPEAEYRVLIDGQEVGVDGTRIGNVLIGSREVSVVATTGADPGAEVLRRRIDVREGQVVRLGFEIEEPPQLSVAGSPDGDTGEPPTTPPVEATDPTGTPATDVTDPANTPTPVEPTEEPAEAPDDATAEAEAASARPWRRAVRSTPGRRPIVAFGASWPLSVRWSNGDTFSLPDFAAASTDSQWWAGQPYWTPGLGLEVPGSVWGEIDFARRLYAAFIRTYDHAALPLAGQSREDSAEANDQYLTAGNPLRVVPATWTNHSLLGGVRLLDARRGSFAVDLVPTLRVGLTSSGVVLVAATDAAGVEEGDFVAHLVPGQQYSLSAGGGVFARVHLGRLYLRVSIAVDRERLLWRDFERDGFPRVQTVGVTDFGGEPLPGLYNFGPVSVDGGSTWALTGHIGFAMSLGGRRRRAGAEGES
jgi:TolB-like protein